MIIIFKQLRRNHRCSIILLPFGIEVVSNFSLTQGWNRHPDIWQAAFQEGSTNWCCQQWWIGVHPNISSGSLLTGPAQMKCLAAPIFPDVCSNLWSFHAAGPHLHHATQMALLNYPGHIFSDLALRSTPEVSHCLLPPPPRPAAVLGLLSLAYLILLHALSPTTSWTLAFPAADTLSSSPNHTDLGEWELGSFPKTILSFSFSNDLFLSFAHFYRSTF